MVRQLESIRKRVFSDYLKTALVPLFLLVAATLLLLYWARRSMVDSMEVRMKEVVDRSLSVHSKEYSYTTVKLLLGNMERAAMLARLFEHILVDLPVATGEPHWSTDRTIEYTLEYGAFFSKSSQLSTETLDIVNKVVCLDILLPKIFVSKEYTLAYAGFEFDHLLYFYPADFFEDEDYSPYKNEWYYKSVEAPNNITITDAYIGDSGAEPILTFAKAITINQRVIGVAALDLALSALQSLFLSSEGKLSGFPILVSSGGAMLAFPSKWTHIEPLTRIDQTELTGISTELWVEIQDPAKEGTRMYFTDPLGTVHLFLTTRVHVPGLTDANMYFLLFCLEESKVFEEYEALEEYLITYSASFWKIVVVSGTSTLVSVIVLFLGTSRTIHYLHKVSHFIKTILKNAHKPRLAMHVDRSILDNIQRWNKELHEACFERAAEQEFLESQHHEFWGDIRPMDVSLFGDWRKQIYPLNGQTEQISNLGKEILNNLKKKITDRP